MSILELKNLSGKIGNFFLDNINLEILNNEYFVLLGQSGSGKTKLLESIAGLNKCSGEIIFEKKNITNIRSEKREIAFVYQDFALFPTLNVAQNIKFSNRYKKIKNEHELYDDLISFLKLEKLLDRDIKDLSGGEKQRVAIARALYSRPKILLLDEPLSAIDPTFKSSIMKSLKEIHKRYDLTTIHVTHNFREASHLADKIAIIIDGKIVQVGTSNDVLTHPKNMDVAKFLGFKNIFPISMLELISDSKFYSIDPSVIYVSQENNLNNDYVFEGIVDECIGIVDHYKLFVRVNEYQFFIKISKREYLGSFEESQSQVFIGFNKNDIGFIQ